MQVCAYVCVCVYLSVHVCVWEFAEVCVHTCMHMDEHAHTCMRNDYIPSVSFIQKNLNDLPVVLFSEIS